MVDIEFEEEVARQAYEEAQRRTIPPAGNGLPMPAPRDTPNAFDVMKLAVAPAHLARWVTLAMAFALFVFAMRAGTWGHLAVAATFTAMVHCPLWWSAWKERRR